MEAMIILRPGESPLVQFRDDQGGFIEKTVLPEALYQLIGESLVEDNGWPETPWLSPNTVHYAQSGNLQKIMIFVPGEPRNIWFFEERIEQMPFPHLLMGFTLAGMAVMEKYVVAVKDSLILPDTQLYRYPYSNIYRDARACWHGLPEIREIGDVRGLPAYFFACPDNGDLYFPDLNAAGLEYRQLLESLKGKQFPSEILTKRGETAADLWARM